MLREILYCTLKKARIKLGIVCGGPLTACTSSMKVKGLPGQVPFEEVTFRSPISIQKK